MVAGPGFSVAFRGEVDVDSSNSGVAVSADGGFNAIQGLGVRLELQPGESAVFSGLGGGQQDEPEPEPAEPDPSVDASTEPSPDVSVGPGSNESAAASTAG